MKRDRRRTVEVQVGDGLGEIQEPPVAPAAVRPNCWSRPGRFCHVRANFLLPECVLVVPTSSSGGPVFRRTVVALAVAALTASVAPVPAMAQDVAYEQQQVRSRPPEGTPVEHVTLEVPAEWERDRLNRYSVGFFDYRPNPRTIVVDLDPVSDTARKMRKEARPRQLLRRRRWVAYREVNAGACIVFPSRERRTTWAHVGLRRRFAPGLPAAGSTSAAGRPLAPADGVLARRQPAQCRHGDQANRDRPRPGAAVLGQSAHGSHGRHLEHDVVGGDQDALDALALDKPGKSVPGRPRPARIVGDHRGREQSVRDREPTIPARAGETTSGPVGAGGPHGVPRDGGPHADPRGTRDPDPEG